MVSFFNVFRLQFCILFYLPMHAICLARLILLDFIALTFGEEYKFESLLLYDLSIVMLFPLSHVQIFCSALCCQKLSICVHPLGRETKFGTHIEQEMKLRCCVF